MLLMHGESPTRGDKQIGLTSLHAAALGNHSACMNMLLGNGAKIDDADKRGRQLIHYAVMTRQSHLIVQLVARGADVNARDKSGATPLHLACYIDAYENVTDFLDAILLLWQVCQSVLNAVAVACTPRCLRM